MLELVYYDTDNEQVHTDPDEVQRTTSMWRKFVWSAPSSYAKSLAAVNWKGKEAPTVEEVAVRLRQYEESLSSSAVKKLSQEFQQFKEEMSYSPPVWAASQLLGTSVPLLRRGNTEATYPGAPCGSTCVTTERT